MSLKDQIFEQEFKMIFSNNKLNIINYTSILHFDSLKIIILSKDKTYIINGVNLVVSRLLVDELLISGDIETIEFR